MGLCVAKVHTFTDIEYDVEDLENGVDFMTKRLPTELLLKIMCYLPTCDKILMRYVSRRFRHVSETPLLWKEFVWPDHEPCHSRQVSRTLKMCCEHVRRISFPAHVCLKPMKVLEMGRRCTKVIHLSLSKTSPQLSLHYVEEILCTLTHLQQLDLCIDGSIDGEFMEYTGFLMRHDDFLEGVLKLTAASVRKLKLQINDFRNSVHAIAILRRWARNGNPLPSTIDIFTAASSNRLIFKLLEFWSDSSSELLPFEIGLYDHKRIPMNLYFPMPIVKFQFGPVATPPLVRLSDHGIMDLSMFYLNEYDHHGVVKYTIFPTGIMSTDQYGMVRRILSLPFISLRNEKLYNCMNNLYAVSSVDVSYSGVYYKNLMQLATACPNLQRLNLQGNVECLAYFLGLNAIIHNCQNLEGLNLAGIPSSSVQSSLGLWELLSSMKKLTHLAIDLCLLKPFDTDNKECIINNLKCCNSLQALELHCGRWCNKCSDNKDFLFSHLPSLMYCRMSNFVYSGFKYAITNCRNLKYLYEEYAYEELESLLPLSSVCHLQQLYVDAAYFNVTDELAHALSAHRGLECVVLHVNTITFGSIIILINNSPNLVLLHLSSNQSLLDENGQNADFTEKIRDMFSYHKLFVIGSFKVRVDDGSSVHTIQQADLFNTNLNSLWV